VFYFIIIVLFLLAKVMVAVISKNLLLISLKKSNVCVGVIAGTLFHNPILFVSPKKARVFATGSVWILQTSLANEIQV
jgi:hypothetical protein